ARIVRLRANLKTRGGTGGLIAATGLCAVAIMLNEFPYRIVWHNGYEKVFFNGNRCYCIGEHLEDQLIYCPDTTPPRNHIVSRIDAALVRSGVTESIFTPSSAGAPDSRKGVR